MSAALITVVVAAIVTTIPLVVWLPNEVRFVIGLAAGAVAAQAATRVFSRRHVHRASKDRVGSLPPDLVGRAGHHLDRQQGSREELERPILSGRTPQPLLVGPFGSWHFANIELFNFSPTDAPPSSPFAAFIRLLAGLWLIVTVIPGVSVAVRRLHDSNLSGWWALLALVPFGTSVLLLLALRRSRPEGARFDMSLRFLAAPGPGSFAGRLGLPEEPSRNASQSAQDQDLC